MNAEIVALLVKASAILSGAAVIVFLLRNSSAARRHFVWSTAMTSVLVLMLLQLIIPPIILPVAENSAIAAFAHQSATDKSKRTVGSSYELVNETMATAATSSGRELSVPAEWQRGENSAIVADYMKSHNRNSTALRSRATDSTDIARNSTTKFAVPFAGATTPTSANAPITQVNDGVALDDRSFNHVTSNFQSISEQARTGLLIAWVVGTVLLLLRLVVAHLQLRNIARSSNVVIDSNVRNELDRIASRLIIGRPVRVLVHANITTPSTAGWRNPIVMLPSSHTKWTATRRTAVLTHELAHIARRDSLSQTVASIVCALFWFHPGFWLALRLLRAEGERAADDCVISSGMTPVDYAGHLIAIATASARSEPYVPTVAIGMARSSQLELRLQALLNSRQHRHVFSRARQRVLSTAALFAVAPLAALQARVQPPKPRPVPPVVVPAVQSPKVVKPITQPPTIVAPAPQLPAPVAAPTVQPPVVLAPVPRSVILPLPSRDVIPPPLPSRALNAPSLPSRDVVSPPPPSRAVNAPPLPSRDVVSPPPPSRAVNAPPLPSRDAVSPPLPGRDAIAPSLPNRNVMSPPIVIAPPRAVPQAVIRVDTTFERSIDAVVGDSLYVNLKTGGNLTVNGWDSPNARLVAKLGGTRWRDAQIVFAQGPKGLQLITAPDQSTIINVNRGMILSRPIAVGDPSRSILTAVEYEFELWVPRRTNVRFTSAIGALTLRDLNGDIDGSTKLGAIDIANTRGKTNLTTDNGDIRVASSSLSGSVQTGCGTLNVSNGGSALAATTKFDPTPSNDPRYAGNLYFLDGILFTEYCRLKPRVSSVPGVDESIPYGPISIDSAPNGGRLSTKSGDVKLGSSAGVLSASTSKGDIEIGRMAGDLTAITGSGNITTKVINTTDEVHNVWIRAKNGTVTLQLPDNLDAELDIETTYTQAFLEQFKRPARIRDDRALPQTETAAWYRINDEPLRKAVRTKGTLGKGAGRIYIRVTDGDVVLERTHS